MSKLAIPFLSMLLLAVQLHSVHAKCKDNKNLTEVAIPNNNALMTLSDFNNSVVGNDYQEMYFVVKRPLPYTPYQYYVLNFTTGNSSSSYNLNAVAEDGGSCTNPDKTLTALSGDRTWFQIEGENRKYAIWSTNPQRYFWALKCKNHEENSNVCPIANVNFGLFLRGNQTDLPMADIVQDLCEGSGLKFSNSSNFVFYYSLNKKTVC